MTKTADSATLDHSLGAEFHCVCKAAHAEHLDDRGVDEVGCKRTKCAKYKHDKNPPRFRYDPAPPAREAYE